MAPALFIAVQCCQCSTMQVKQQKKSSNKWTCVVCNEKQSVRRIYAQGFIAKDVRKFVQSFNMSRQSVDPENLDPESDRNVLAGIDEKLGGASDDCRKPKRSNWCEYLDPEDAVTSEEVEEDYDGKIEIVTELPKNMFKKPKLGEENSSQLGGPEHSKLYKPPFTRRHTRTKVEPRKFQLTDNTRESKIIDLTNVQSTSAPRASKWSNYITEVDDDLQSENNRNHESELDDQWDYTAITATTHDQRVEDDIHPDFL